MSRLRRFVLDLAVRGKLVEQDPGDEPASELLKRIAAEKARLVKAGEIRKPRDRANGDAIVPPFDIPGSWCWCRLDTVGAIIGGGTPSASDPENFAKPGDGIPWLTPADLGGFRELFIERGSRDLTEKGLTSSSATVMPAGTVLFTSRAPIGYVAIAANPISTNQGFKSIVPYVADCSRFVALAMQTFAPHIDARAPGTTFKEVSGKIVAGVPIPLPPLAEQRRIVAKVEELMALIERLEAARTARETTRDRLTAASLARLTAPDTQASSGKVGTGFPSDDAPKKDPAGALPAEVGTGSAPGNATNKDAFPANARFALATLPALTTRPDQIKPLRQTILNLAVRGKLVDQDPTDEPASELLKRIAVEKAAMKGRKGARTRNEAASIAPSGMAIPHRWESVRLDAISTFENGDRSSNYPSGPDIKSEGIPFFSTKNLSDHRLGFTDLDFISPEKFGSLRSGKLKDLDILITLRGSVGKFGLFKASEHITTGFINAQLLIIRCLDPEIVPYLVTCMQSDDFEQQIALLSSGAATPQLSAGKLAEAMIPLPPLTEQHRIVAKVDALIALCDRLEAALTTTDTTRARLLEALLHEALAPATEAMEAAE